MVIKYILKKQKQKNPKNKTKQPPQKKQSSCPQFLLETFAYTSNKYLGT